MKKTFKIGEYVVGGIIEVVSNKESITINFRDMFGKTNDILVTKSFLINSRDVERDILFYISDNGTSYYADKVLDYIKSKIDIPRLNHFGW